MSTCGSLHWKHYATTRRKRNSLGSWVLYARSLGTMCSRNRRRKEPRGPRTEPWRRRCWRSTLTLSLRPLKHHINDRHHQPIVKKANSRRLDPGRQQPLIGVDNRKTPKCTFEISTELQTLLARAATLLYDDSRRLVIRVILQY